VIRTSRTRKKSNAVFFLAALVLAIAAAGVIILTSPYVMYFFELAGTHFEHCRSLEARTLIEIQGLNSSDSGEMNQVVNITVLLSYVPSPSKYNENNTDGCEFLHENAAITIRREKEPPETFEIQINGTFTFKKEIKLTSDGLWRIEAERVLAFRCLNETYTRKSRNPDNQHAFKVFTAEELKSLRKSTEPRPFWENPLAIGIITTVLGAMLALAGKVFYDRRKGERIAPNPRGGKNPPNTRNITGA
jgi:hypothetical protein